MYTGRGPVCGTIIRGCTIGRCAIGTPGLGAAVPPVRPGIALELATGAVGTCVGTIMRGGGAGAVGAETGAFATGAAGFASGAGGFTATGRAGGAAGGAGCCLLMIAFRTSPGFEILDRSILVLMPSDSLRAERADFAEEADSADPRKWRRTLSASCSSSELE